MQAVLVAVIAAVMSLVLPPLSHISGATVALVTLRNGAVEGALITAGSALILLLLGFVSAMGSGLVDVFVISLVVAVWLPALFCAQVLRKWRSLSMALTTAGLIALGAMLVFYLAVGDVRAWWYTILKAVFEPMLTTPSMPLSEGEVENWLNSFAAIMTGVVAATLLLTAMINLSLARWWQALLFNPGGFRQEFHGLRLDWRIAAAVLPVAIMSSLLSEGPVQGFGQDAMVLVMAMFSVPGLALLHAVVAHKKIHRAALIAVYVLMIFILPQMVMILAATGLTDSWLDFRRRLGIR
jgi:hypothetical protein